MRIPPAETQWDDGMFNIIYWDIDHTTMPESAYYVAPLYVTKIMNKLPPFGS